MMVPAMKPSVYIETTIVSKYAERPVTCRR
jgi:hypothetical protein